MSKATVTRILRPVGFLLAGAIAVILFSSAVADPAEGPADPPQKWEMILFGGPGEQLGQSVAVRGNTLIVGAQDDTLSGGILRSYSLPLSPTYDWTVSEEGRWDVSLVPTGTNFFVASAAKPSHYGNPGYCGGDDSYGDREGKVRFARYSLTGSSEACTSYNFFPYRGGEYYMAVALSQEGGTNYFYAGGLGEQMGGGYSFPFLLAKYDTAGNMLFKASEPGIGWDWPPEYVGRSAVYGLVVLNGYVYAAGESYIPYSGEDYAAGDWIWAWGQRPKLMKYDFNLNPVSTYRADIGASYPGYSGRFSAVAALDNYLYAAGGGIPTGGTNNTDYLVEKFDEDGTRIWSASWGGPYFDMLTGIVAVGDRLFVVGYGYKTPNSDYWDGDSDAVLFEIDPADGSVLLSESFGGENVEWARSVATDGQDLYIIGHSFSYASDEGNLVGQKEVMLIHYRLNSPPLGEDQAVHADWGLATNITLTGSDPDNDALTYGIVDSPLHGRLTGQAPNVVYTSDSTYYGPDAFTFKVNDGHVDSEIATVRITVDRRYAFTGFDSPVDNVPVVNSAKAGAAIPVKWRITDLCGGPISNPSCFTGLKACTMNCGALSGDPTDELETYSGASGLQYFGDGYWQFNWKTSKTYAGKCYLMVLTLDDGRMYTAYFKFK